MIPYVFCESGLRTGLGFAPAGSALVIAIIEAAFFRLPIRAVGVAELRPAGEAATGGAAIDLPSFARRANEEQNSTARPTTKAMPERSGMIVRHV